MKTYKVTVNGNKYEITIELIDKNDATPQTKNKQNDAKPQNSEQGSVNVSSPMPGTILKVNVTNGETVKKGDVLMILEAMKMENEIMSPCDGTIKSVNVKENTPVETNTLLCTIS